MLKVGLTNQTPEIHICEFQVFYDNILLILQKYFICDILSLFVDKIQGVIL